MTTALLASGVGAVMPVLKYNMQSKEEHPAFAVDTLSGLEAALAPKLKHHLDALKNHPGETLHEEKAMLSASTVAKTSEYGKNLAAHKSHITVSEYLMAIIQQNEVNNGRSEIGPDLIADHMPAVAVMADAILNKGLSVKKAGRLIGHHGVFRRDATGAPIAVNIDDFKIAMDDLVASKNIEPISAKDFYSNVRKPGETKEFVAEMLKITSGPEKAVFAAVWPNSVLEDAGLSKDQIVEMRKQAKEHTLKLAAAYALEFEKKEGVELKDSLHWKPEQIKAMRMLASELHKGDLDKVQAMVESIDHSVISSMRSAMISEATEQGLDGTQSFAERFKQGESIIEKIKAQHEQKKAAHDYNEDRALHMDSKKHHSDDLEESVEDRQARLKERYAMPKTHAKPLHEKQEETSWKEHAHTSKHRYVDHSVGL